MLFFFKPQWSFFVPCRTNVIHESALCGSKRTKHLFFFDMPSVSSRGKCRFLATHSARTRTRWNEYVTYCSATSDNKQPIVLLRERKKAQQHDASMGLSPVKSSDTNRLPRQGILPLWDILRPAALNERKLVTRERVRRVFWASGCSAVRCAPRP